MTKKYHRPTEVRLILPCQNWKPVVQSGVEVEVKLQGLTPMVFPGVVTNILSDAIEVSVGGLAYSLRFDKGRLNECITVEYKGRKVGAEQRKLW